MRNVLQSIVPLEQRLRTSAIGLILCGLVLLPFLGFAGGPPPVITLQPLAQTTLPGSSVSFYVVASSSTTMTYQWRKDGTNIAGATQATFTIASVSLTDAGSYSVRIVNAGGSVTSSDATLTVQSLPVIITQPQSRVVGQGQNATFSVAVLGTSPFGYQWTLQGAPIFGATNSSCTVLNAQTNHAGEYAVIVTNLLGTAISDSASLVVVTSSWWRVVANSSDSGAGSLRQALLDAGNSGVAGTKQIVFNITNGSSGGPFTINLASSLPQLTNNLVIDGYTQPGSRRNTLTNGNNAVIRICLTGSSVAGGANGFDIGLPGCAVYGLSIVNFGGHGFYARSAGNPIIQGNFIGLLPDGVTLAGNANLGIRATSFGGIIIGGAEPWQRNVISGNGGGAISFQNCPNNVVQGNFIGTDASGTLARGNGAPAIYLGNPNASGNTIGGTQPGQGNVIAGTAGGAALAHGISVVNTTGNSIQGNFIGTDLSATLNLGNAGCGIFMTNATSGNNIGGTTSGSGNVIAFNGSAGVWLQSGTNSVLGNSIFSNTGLGIDLGAQGVEANDWDDTDMGPNDLQNYPVVDQVTDLGGAVRIQGVLRSRTGRSYRLEFFGTPSPNSSAARQGKVLMGTTNVALSGSLVQSFVVQFANPWGTSVTVTATATDPFGSTSEFSLPVGIGPATVPLALTSQPTNQTVMVGQSAAFSVTAQGDAALAYQWYFNSAVLAGATNATLSLSNVQASNAGSYHAMVSNANSSVTSAVATLTVLAPPSITAQPQSQVVAPGQPVAFSVGASGTGPLSYQWRFNGTPIPGATNSTFTLAAAQLSHEGAYSATVSNLYGTVNSSSASLTVVASVTGSGAMTSVTATNVASRTWPHTVSSGVNRLLLVGIALADTTKTVTNVTYGGVPLTPVTSSQSKNTVQMWAMVAPPIGTADIVVSWNGSQDMMGWSGTFTNVDQTGPFRTSAATGATTANPTVTVSSQTGDLVLATLSANGDAGTLTPSTNQTQFCQGNTGTSGGSCWGAAASAPGGGSITMSWVTGASKDWELAAVVVKAAPAVQADVVTTITGPSVVIGGANAAFTITVSNASSVVASNVVVTDTLSGDAGFSSVAGGGVFSNGVVTWPAFNLPANTSTNFSLILSAAGSGAILNTVASTAATYDPDALNNNGTAVAAAVATSIIPQGVAGSPGATDSSYAATTNLATRTWSHTVSAGENRVLLVGIALADTGKSVTSLTYGGLPLTRIVASSVKNTVEMWYRLAPPVGTANIVANWSGSEDMVGWGGSFTNVDQTSPIRNFATAFGSSISPGITLAAAAGDLVVDTLSANGDASSLTVGAGQTQFGQRSTGTSGGDCWGASSFRPGANSVNMGWTTGSSKDWELAAVALKVATPVQADLTTSVSGPATVPSGTSFTCTVTLVNQGPQTASNIVVGALLPAGLNFLSATGGGVTNNQGVVWTIPSLANAASVNLDFTVSASAPGSFTNTVSATAATSDPYPGNNTSKRIVSVTAVAPTIVNQPQSQTVTAGASVMLQVVASGTAPFGYQWHRNGNPLPGANAASLLLNNVQSSDCGDYSVLVTNTAGSAVSLAAPVVVTNPPPVLTPTTGGSVTTEGFSFGVEVPVGSTFVIEASDNMVDWSPIATNVAATASVLITDAAATNHPRRFYRALVR